MKKVHFYIFIWPLLLTSVLFTACNGQDKSREKVLLSEYLLPNSITPPDSQVAQYIRHIFQDKNGNFWFGTNGYGTGHYDASLNNPVVMEDPLTYFSNAQGFGGQQITGITEDLNKNIWFATDQGIVKYDWSIDQQGGKRFTNYSSEQYFGGQRFWSIFADSKGYIWAGGVTGIFRFDGFIWTAFELPYPEVISGKFITSGTTWSITEDVKGNVWFSTNGYGVFKYSLSSELTGGQSFTQYSEKDGLTDNSVDVIMEDSNGNMWFGTRHGGISRYGAGLNNSISQDMTFTNYTAADSIGDNEVCTIYEDKKGNIWFSSEGYGVYRYTTSLDESGDRVESFTNYSQEQGLGVLAVQDIFEDRDGHLWVGGGGGLYRLVGDTFINVKRNGPWN